MVNRNHPLLVATLENAANGIRPGGNNEEQGGLNNQGNGGFGFPLQPLAGAGDGENNNQDDNLGNEGNNGSVYIENLFIINFLQRWKLSVKSYTR